MTRLAGKVALVTGGSAGIGRATALIYAREGAKVVVSDIAVEGGEETVRKIKENGGEAVFIKANVVNDAEVKELIDKTVSTYGSIDCAFNNAGILGEMAPTADCTEENFDKVININLKGVFLCLKHEIPQMLKQGGGAIVNTASIAGLIGFPTAPAYVASKGGVVQITRVSALEYADKGIRINAVCPGGIETEMISGMEENLLAAHPIGRLGKPEEIGEAVVWLSSPAASFVTGHIMAVDGGYTAQ